VKTASAASVVPPGEAIAAATKFARRLARGHRKAIEGSKAAVNKYLREGANLVLDTSLAAEKECMMADGYTAAVTKLMLRFAQPTGT